MKFKVFLCVWVISILCILPSFGETYDTSNLTDFVFAAPEEGGYDVRQVLVSLKGMGYLKELSSTEETYKEKYIDIVKEMEEAYGLTVDGVIMYSEWEKICSLRYPSMQGASIKQMLEKLHDLGFITSALPDTHETYSSTYVSAVKKAETQYNLTADGVLTPEEWKVINSKAVTRPAAPTNVKATIDGSTATVTWSSVKGALFYEILRDGVRVGTTKGTSFTDKNLPLGFEYFYEVKACKYTVKGASGYANNSVVACHRPNAKELSEKYSQWKYEYVKMTYTSYVSKTWEGDDLYYLVKKSHDEKTYYFYLLLEDVNDSWDWDDGDYVYNHSVYRFDFMGYCEDKKKNSQYGMIPVINVSSFTYWYN